MRELKDIIEDLLSIPYVEESTPVFDGSYALVPWMTNGLQGDGLVRTSKTSVYIELFYTDKVDCIDSAISLWKTICATKGMTASDPDYTYEEDANMWRASIPTEIINKEEY